MFSSVLKCSLLAIRTVTSPHFSFRTLITHSQHTLIQSEKMLELCSILKTIPVKTGCGWHYDPSVLQGLTKCTDLMNQLELLDVFDPKMCSSTSSISAKRSLQVTLEELVKHRANAIDVVKGRKDPDTRQLGFDVSVFMLPSHSSLPLHNHPDMIVLTKVLYGSMHVRSFTMDGPTSRTPMHASLARHEVRTKSCNAWELYPDEGNVHQFTTAEVPCIFVDVILPPYDGAHGRDCNFFSEVEIDNHNTCGEQGQYHLQEASPPWEMLPTLLYYPTVTLEY